MKTTIQSILFTCAAVCPLAFGQITINQNDFPAADQQYLVNNATNLSVDFTTTGANKVWDYSQLTAQNQNVKKYQTVASAGMLVNFTFGPQTGNYAASYRSNAVDFDLSNIPVTLPITLGEISQFYKKDANKITTVGYSLEVNGQKIPVKSDTIETKYIFPLTFGTNYTSRGFTKLNLEPIFAAEMKQYRQIGSVVDGYGKVTTPFGTFDAIRIKHSVSEQDSFNLTGTWMGFAQPDVRHYEWLATAKKEPVLRITTRIVAGVEVVNSVTYLTDQLLSTSQLEAMSFQFYPNPAREILTIASDLAIDQLIISDLNGKIVKSVSSVGVHQVVDIVELEKGAYFITAISNGISKIQKFVKL